jgi:hypothetical protein
VTVRAVLFEHSPGRGDAALTGDRTAFDAMLIYSRPNGASGFVAIEVKYSESMTEPQRELRPRYADLAPAAGLHRDPAAPSLGSGVLQQFFRQHLLAQAMLMRGAYPEGRFLVIAPELNTAVQSAISAYADELVPIGPAQAGFSAWSLEDVIAQLRVAGERGYAAALHRRYCDWTAVDRVIDDAIAAMVRPSEGANDNRAEEASAAA